MRTFTHCDCRMKFNPAVRRGEYPTEFTRPTIGGWPPLEPLFYCKKYFLILP